MPAVIHEEAVVHAPLVSGQSLFTKELNPGTSSPQFRFSKVRFQTESIEQNVAIAHDNKPLPQIAHLNQAVQESEKTAQPFAFDPEFSIPAGFFEEDFLYNPVYTNTE